MTEFAAANALGVLGKQHYDIIRKRFTELNLVQVRRRRDKAFAETVWVRKEEANDVDTLAMRLKELTI
jgi:hypothetical protein